MGAGSMAFSDAIRQAAGRAPAAPARATMPVGDLGIGRGGGALERHPQPPLPTMTNLIRAERDMRREERLARARAYEHG
jgi:hypothetical protein